MLINFTVGNYRSFKEKKTLSMEATAIKELPGSVVNRDGYKLLSSAVIYGANSSGKSNFLKAIDTFKDLILTSSKLNSTDKLNVTPFLLNEKISQSASYFEIELLLGENAYRYGFEANTHRVCAEWLYMTGKGSKEELCLFVRTEEGIGVTDDYPEGRGLEERTRDNALFLAVVDSFNGKIAQQMVNKTRTLTVVSGLDHEYLSVLTAQVCVKDSKSLFSKDTVDLLHRLDIGFDTFEIPDDEELVKKVKAYTVHSIYNDEGQAIGETRFAMKDYESSGTNKLFDLAIVIVLGLQGGNMIIIDELDSKLHPLLTRQLVALFNDPKTNPAGGQLIFATHDTNLLNIKTFRRDQIWFTEKDHTEATDLYSLVEFKEPDGTKVRNDRSFEKDYINGRYGAIPYIKS